MDGRDASRSLENVLLGVPAVVVVRDPTREIPPEGGKGVPWRMFDEELDL